MKVHINLSPEQLEFIRDPHPLKVLIAGRQWGKSHAVMADLTATGVSTRGRSAVVMPVQSQATDFYKVMLEGENFEQLLAHPPKLWPHPQVTFRSGHYLEYRSFETPKRLRSGKWTGRVVCDEANDLEGDDIAKIILPKVSATQAIVVVTSTITHHNWLLDLYMSGLDEKNKVVKSFNWKNNPYPGSVGWPTPTGIMFQGAVGKQRLEDLKSITPKHVWDSEYLCIPGADNTTAFPYWERCLTDDNPPSGPIAGLRYLIGLDLGRSRDGEVAICADDTGQICEYVDFPTGSAALEHSQMANRIAAMSRFWGAPVVIDSTGKGGAGGTLSTDKDSYVEVYKAACGAGNIIEMIWSGNRDNNTKYDVITFLALATEQKKLRCSRKFRELDTQMKQYRILKAKGQNSTFGPTPGSGHNDDAVAALAQLVWGGFKKNRWRARTDDPYSAADTSF